MRREDPYEGRPRPPAAPQPPYVEWGPELPSRYGEEALRLCAQEPRRLYCYWEAPAATDLTLELRDVGSGASRALARGLGELGECWIDAEPDRRYQVALVGGDRERASNVVRTPRETPSDEVESDEPPIEGVTPPGPSARAARSSDWQGGVSSPGRR